MACAGDDEELKVVSERTHGRLGRDDVERKPKDAFCSEICFSEKVYSYVSTGI